MNDLAIDYHVGHDLNRCAEICALETINCGGFQFCFNPHASGPMQNCITLSIASQEDIPDSDDRETILRAQNLSKYFVPSSDCHIFSLKLDNSHIRAGDQLFKGNSTDELSEFNTLSLGGALLLYSTMTLLFTAVSCGLFLFASQNKLIRNKLEQVILGE